MVVFASIYYYFFMMSSSIDARLDILVQVEKQLIAIVQDDNRETKALDVINQMKVTVKKQNEDYSVIQSEFLKVNADYNADIQQYNALDKQVGAFWRATMKQQVNLRFALREQLSRDDWEKLYKDLK